MKKNETGRSVHQATKSVVDEAQALVDYYHARTRLRDSETEKYKRNWYTLEDMAPGIHKLEASLKAARGEQEPVPRKPYTRTNKVKGAREDQEVHEAHESYGLVQINRSSSTGSRLFGSSVSHQHIFRLTVRRAVRTVDRFSENFRSDHRVPIVEIMLTPAQFVEMITTQNIGDGGPCTISSVEGVRMDAPPEDAGSELRLIKELFVEEFTSTVNKLRTQDKELAKILEKKSFSKDDKEEIQQIVTRVRRLMDDSMPYALQTFGENVEKMAAKGKLEVESFIQLALHKMGIKAIKDAGGQILLGRGEEDDEG